MWKTSGVLMFKPLEDVGNIVDNVYNLLIKNWKKCLTDRSKFERVTNS